MDRNEASQALAEATVLILNGRLPDALPALERVVDGIAEAEGLALIVAFTTRALDETVRRGPWDRPSQALSLYLLAWVFLAIGRLKQSAETLDDARTLDPQSPWNQAIDAMIAQAQSAGDTGVNTVPATRNLWLAALLRAPDCPEINCGYASYLLQQRTLSAARRHIEMAIVHAPDWQLARCIAAEIWMADGDMKRAKAHLEIASHLHGNRAAFEATRGIVTNRESWGRRALYAYTRLAFGSTRRVLIVTNIALQPIIFSIVAFVQYPTWMWAHRAWVFGIIAFAWVPLLLARWGRSVFRVRIQQGE
ncbi:hypothetical protein sos41_19940 [Alphaproteobacteria bacterium SO-S41]|nr:hypothetical protein sos41_19940 [Alphaproteobacteria bacterium SO-S41]